MELRRLRFDEQVRSEKRKSAGTLIESAGDRRRSSPGARWSRRTRTWPAAATSRPSSPPTSGRCISARAPTNTASPVEFFRRTYLTESLKRLLVGAVQRLAGQGGDPVVQLQTNFGGGKTHSMLALYHLFSGSRPSELAGIDAVLQEAGVEDAADGQARGAGGQQDLARQSGHQARRHGGAHALGRAGLAARRQEGLRSASRPTTRRRPAPATCCASCSTSTGRA